MPVNAPRRECWESESERLTATSLQTEQQGRRKQQNPTNAASTTVPNGTIPWFQRDADPSKLAKTRERQEKKREERIALTAALAERNSALPAGQRKYSAIYADPPWSFNVWSEAGNGNSAENHYDPQHDYDACCKLATALLRARLRIIKALLWKARP